jgi:hypothetical protein
MTVSMTTITNYSQSPRFKSFVIFAFLLVDFFLSLAFLWSAFHPPLGVYRRRDPRFAAIILSVLLGGGVGMHFRAQAETCFIYYGFYALAKLIASLTFLGAWMGGGGGNVAKLALWHSFGVLVIGIVLLRSWTSSSSHRRAAKEERFFSSATSSLSGMSPDQSIICPKCKNRTVGQSWCLYCGTDLQSENTPKSQPPDDSYRRRLRDLE